MAEAGDRDEPGSPPTHAIVLWGLQTEENDQLIVDRIDSMQDLRPVAG